MTTQRKCILNRRCAFAFLMIFILVYCVLNFELPITTDEEFISYNLESDMILDLKRLINLSSLYNKTQDGEPNYVVYGPRCKIRNVNPFHTDVLPFHDPKPYIKCQKNHLLTYVKKQNNAAVLYVDEHYVKEYTNTNIDCCYRTIIRRKRFGGKLTPDLSIFLTPCTNFKSKANISSFVLVKCKDKYSKEIYKNVHATVTKTKEIKEKMKSSKQPNQNHLSVLILGIDGMSRLNFIRSLPQTYLYLKRNKWLEFKGFNKIGENTFPNLMGMLTGLNGKMSYETCNPKLIGPLDRCNLIWYDYRRLGFITGYAEDEMKLSTFSHLGGGFYYKPTDYYFKPYTVASELYLQHKIVDAKKYCTGPETAGERILNVARDFTLTFKDYPYFGLFWMNSFSHNNINSASRMDEKIFEFLQDLNRSGALKNSLVLFLSDHGLRFGDLPYTRMSWLEERMPLLYMSVPKWFQKKHVGKYKNLVINAKRLTTPYDVYMTLQEIFILSGKEYNIKISSGCPKCRSLFEEVDEKRSCDDAGIDRHWCTCFNYMAIPLNHIIPLKAAKFIISQARKILLIYGNEHKWCARFRLKQINAASIFEDSNVIYILLTFTTNPLAVFQATVSVNTDTKDPIFRIAGDFSRLDEYGRTSWCINDKVLKRYCYCLDDLFNKWWWHVKNAVAMISNFIE